MIECSRCGREHPSDVVHDQTKCECGNLITAFMTEPDGMRISQDKYLASRIESPTLTQPHPGRQTP